MARENEKKCKRYGDDINIYYIILLYYILYIIIIIILYYIIILYSIYIHINYIYRYSL